MGTVVFTTEQVEHAKKVMLCDYLREQVDSGSLNLLQALQEQMRINDVFARGQKDIENGDYMPASPAIIKEIKYRASQLRK